MLDGDLENISLECQGGVCLLAYVSLFSIGLASWNINANAISENDVMIDADGGVINLVQFININPFVDMFKISKYGLEKDYTISYTGTAVFSFDLQLEDGLFTLFSKETKYLAFKIKLVDRGSFGLLSTDYMGSSPSVSYIVNGGSATSVKDGSSLSNKTVTTSFGYYNADMSSINKLSFSIIYDFDFSSYASSFESDIYNKVASDAFSFTFSVWYA